MATAGKFQEWITPENLTVIEGWARDGLTDKQISHNMGIAESTLNNWKRQLPEIKEALKKGKAVADYEVENALFKKATGFKYTEKQVKKNKHGDIISITETVKSVVPDTTAQIFWLKNRKPKNWRDKPEVDADSEVLTKIKELLGGVDSVID